MLTKSSSKSTSKSFSYLGIETNPVKYLAGQLGRMMKIRYTFSQMPNKQVHSFIWHLRAKIQQTAVFLPKSIRQIYWCIDTSIQTWYIFGVKHFFLEKYISEGSLSLPFSFNIAFKSFSGIFTICIPFKIKKVWRISQCIIIITTINLLMIITAGWNSNINLEGITIVITLKIV